MSAAQIADAQLSALLVDFGVTAGNTQILIQADRHLWNATDLRRQVEDMVLLPRVRPVDRLQVKARFARSRGHTRETIYNYLGDGWLGGSVLSVRSVRSTGILEQIGGHQGAGTRIWL
jgi:hypothetical protein